MKRILFILISVMLFLSSFDLFAEQRMLVQVREVVVRSTPNYMGAAAGKVSYGDAVNMISEEGNWVKISSPAGYLPKSAVTKKNLPKGGQEKFTGSSVKHDEVALAGKGFNPQVESQYKSNNAGLAAAYTSVDRIEKFGASDAELRSFQAAGNLKPR